MQSYEKMKRIYKHFSFIFLWCCNLIFVFIVLVMACYTVNYMLDISVANKQHLQHFT